MKFKVGDKVRLTREACIGRFVDPRDATYGEVFGDIIESIGEGGNIQIKGSLQGYDERCLELVPEEPEFEYGENIEVKVDEGFHWVKRPFICFVEGNAIHPYITASIDKAKFDVGKKFDLQAFKYARKIKPKLTRKEIAEKFGVSEDFTLVDDSDD